MTKKQIKPLPPYVTQAGVGKEILAFLLDCLMALAFGLALRFTLGSYVIAPAAGYETARTGYLGMAKESKLYREGDSGSLEIYYFEGSSEATYNNYSTMESVVWRYFYVTCGQTEQDTNFVLMGFSPQETIRSDAYKAEVGKYIYDTVYGITEENPDGNSYYTLSKKEDGTIDYTVAPTLKADVKARIESTDADDRLAAKKDLYTYFMGTTDSSGVSTGCMYYTAISDFSDQPLTVAYSNQGTKAVYLARLPAVIVSPLIFFVIFPLVLKRGKTLGKLITHLSIVDKDGYKAKKAAIALRSVILTVMCELLLLPYSIIISFIAVIGCFLLDYLFIFFTKRRQNMHSLISGTIVIDDRQTEAIFENEEEALEYKDSHTDPLAKEVQEYFEGPSERKETKAGIDKAVASSEILDLDSIAKAREEAENITSFDEFEKKKDAEVDEASKAESKKEPEALEKKLISEAKEPTAKETKKEETKDADPYSDDFVDEKK